MSDVEAKWRHAQTLEPEHWLANRDAILDPAYRDSIVKRSEKLQERLRPFGPVDGTGVSVLEIGGGGTPLIDHFACGDRHSLDPLADFYRAQFGAVLDKGVQWHSGKAEELPFANGTFDVVISRNVLDHVQDDARCLAEVKRVLKPQGIAYVAVNNFSGPLYLFRSAFKDPEHPYTYNHETLDERIRAAGFRVLDVRKDPPEHMGHFTELESKAPHRRLLRSFLLWLDCYHYSEWVLTN